jgi:hypothetical protein
MLHPGVINLYHMLLLSSKDRRHRHITVIKGTT